MEKHQVIEKLTSDLKFGQPAIQKLEIYHDELIKFNLDYNLIGSSTEKDVWNRHILDSAQIVKFIDFKKEGCIADLGTGAGLPGLIIAIYNQNIDFHVKLYEKSKVKCQFLSSVISKLNLNNVTINNNNIKTEEIYANYITCRAFRKLSYILDVSRENIKVSHKLIVLKGKNALEEINSLQNSQQYSYEIKDSITDKESKIIVFDIMK